VSGEWGGQAFADLLDWEAELEAGDALIQEGCVFFFVGVALPGEGAAGEVDEHVGEGFEVVFGGLRLWRFVLLDLGSDNDKKGMEY
jgi:hypothetical protein